MEFKPNSKAKATVNPVNKAGKKIKGAKVEIEDLIDNKQMVDLKEEASGVCIGIIKLPGNSGEFDVKSFVNKERGLKTAVSIKKSRGKSSYSCRREKLYIGECKTIESRADTFCPQSNKGNGFFKRYS